MFNPSVASLIRFRPWRWTTPPTYNPDGTVATPGVKQELEGVFILLSDALMDNLAATLTQAQRDELRTWAHRVSLAEAGEWHVPVWGGEAGAVFIRVPKAIWNNPTGAPPAKVKQYFQHLYRADQP